MLRLIKPKSKLTSTYFSKICFGIKGFHPKDFQGFKPLTLTFAHNCCGIHRFSFLPYHFFIGGFQGKTIKHHSSWVSLDMQLSLYLFRNCRTILGCWKG